MAQAARSRPWAQRQDRLFWRGASTSRRRAEVMAAVAAANRSDMDILVMHFSRPQRVTLSGHADYKASTQAGGVDQRASRC
jgi:hypothetical protein